MLILIVLCQTFLYLDDQRGTQQLADRIVRRVEGVAAARKLAMKRVDEISQEHCSIADIRELKKVVFQSAYMSDVGRFEDGRLLCSALWGVMDGARVPVARHSFNSVHVWNDSDLSQTPYGGSNLLARGNSFVVSSPATLDGLDPTHTRLIEVRSRDRQFFFKRLMPVDAQAFASSPKVRFERCSKTVNSCVIVTGPYRVFWDLPFALVIAVLSCGMAIGIACGHALLRFRASTKANIQKRLDRAIRRREISLDYQPLRRISDGNLVGFEALARWRPDGGEEDIPPSIFVPVAQQMGLSEQLFRYVLRRALIDLAPELRECREIYISVNAEPIDLEDDGIVDYIVSSANQFDVHPSQVRIEITERDALLCPRIRGNIKRLVTSGFCFLIDDFGTGSSNISHLTHSLFAGVKIDRLFTTSVAEDSPLRTVFPGMYRIAAGLGLEVIAEGVETTEQCEALCHLSTQIVGQGWLFGRPMRAESASALIRSELIRGQSH